MLYDMPEATLEPVSSNIYFKSQFTHLFNYNVQALEILSKGFCVCVCVCVSGITWMRKARSSWKKKPKKPNKQCPLLVTYLRHCVWELQLVRSLPCEGGNKAVHVYGDLGAISRSLNIFHYEIKSPRKVFQQERDLIKMVWGRLFWHHIKELNG